MILATVAGSPVFRRVTVLSMQNRRGCIWVSRRRGKTSPGVHFELMIHRLQRWKCNDLGRHQCQRQDRTGCRSGYPEQPSVHLRSSAFTGCTAPSKMYRKSIFLDDNARPDRTYIVDEFFRQNRVLRIERPPMLPGLACIKH